jgi:iron(III) transport system ATP-binding protein
VASKSSTNIRVEHLNLAFEGVQAVADLSFEAPAGSFLTLLGPSGCGKSTTLRCLAGLERPDSGSIWIGDRLVAGPDTFVPPKDRGMGMVFQSYAIWPHMSVFDNIAFGLEGRRLAGAEISTRVGRIADILGIGALLKRYPSQLSGGQQQRVALARSLVYEPAVLLLDEPLSNLDAKLRDQMRFELASIQDRLATTTVYVTHNQEEALAMSDYILMMRDGKAVQFGTPEELYRHPANRYAADFLGDANFFEGKARYAPGDDVTVVAINPELELWSAGRGVDADGTRVVAMIRPSRVRIARDRSERGWRGVVEYIAFLGDKYEVRVASRGVTVRGFSSAALNVGDNVWVEIPVEDTVIVEKHASAMAEAAA